MNTAFSMDTSARPRFSRPRQQDPQIILEGELKACEKADVIVFTIPLVWFELVCIVTVPPEGETKAPVYVKFKMARRGSTRREAPTYFARPRGTSDLRDPEEHEDSYERD